MTQTCTKCRRPIWDGGHALSAEECTDIIDQGLSCKLLELIYRYGPDEQIKRAEAAIKLY